MRPCKMQNQLFKFLKRETYLTFRLPLWRWKCEYCSSHLGKWLYQHLEKATSLEYESYRCQGGGRFARKENLFYRLSGLAWFAHHPLTRPPIVVVVVCGGDVQHREDGDGHNRDERSWGRMRNKMKGCCTISKIWLEIDNDLTGSLRPQWRLEKAARAARARRRRVPTSRRRGSASLLLSPENNDLWAEPGGAEGTLHYNIIVKARRIERVTRRRWKGFASLLVPLSQIHSNQKNMQDHQLTRRPKNHKTWKIIDFLSGTRSSDD